MLKHIKINKILFFTTLFFGVLLMIPSSKAYATDADNIFGNAWTYNTGWISMNNCTNPADASTCSGNGYGVNVTGSTISGYAWSENVGWISFNPGDWVDCPPGATGCNLSSYNNTFSSGWGRALSMTGTGGMDNSGGWDGWISLGGSGYGGTIGTTDIKSQLGIADVTFEVSGYWWGSDVMGWIDLNSDQAGPNFSKGGVYKSDFNKSKLTLIPSKTTVLSGDTVDFTWSITSFNATSCTGSGSGTDTDWTNTKTISPAASSGSYSNIHVPVDATTIFTLTCTNGSQTESDSITINTTPLDPAISYNNSCVAQGGNPPIVSWNVNDLTPNCIINAERADHSSSYTINIGSYSNVGGRSAGTITDSYYTNDYKNTYYTLSCDNGSGSYLAQGLSGQTSVNMCQPNYTVSASTSCGGSPGATMVNNGSGTYEGTVTLTMNPLFGFISDASVSGNPYSGTYSITPTSGFSYNSSSYNTVDVKLSLTTPEYNALYAIMNKSGVLETVVTTITGFAQNTNPKTLNVKFCAGTSGATLKPIYKPF
jgi:hypothetical protein